MSIFEEFFGSELRGADGKPTPTAEKLGDAEVIGLYFSAHWCPPCKAFTPELGKWYTKLTGKGIKMEIVFVSGDRDEAAFTSYADEMPWASLPFDKKDLNNALNKKYKVSGIPTLVFVDKSGKLITKEGRSVVGEDPEGANFPWIPPTFSEALGTSFVRPDGTAVGKEAIAGKTLGLYFSAHWCPPCKGFTPEFAEVYNKAQTRHPGKFEVVFVSSDRDEGSFTGYHKEMPWLALPFSDRKRKDQLSKMFEIQGIPSLVILDADSGEIINKNARGSISGDKEAEKFPWAPSPVGNLESPDGINESPAFIVFAGSSDKATQDTIEAQMSEVSLKMRAAAKAKGEDPMLFLLSRDNNGSVAGKVAKLTSADLTSGGNKAILLDIPDSGGFYEVPVEADLTAAWVEGVIAKYEAKELERKQLQ